jgi:hypothetical protein
MKGVHLTDNEQEAWDMIENLSRCENCTNFQQADLFAGSCSNPEGEKPFTVNTTASCECFAARDKKVGYWIDKLVQMAMDANGVSDFNKQLEYHQDKGTDMKFLGLNK